MKYEPLVWKYKTLVLDPGQDFERHLNEHGREDWELVTVLPVPYGLSGKMIYKCIFKRREPDEGDDNGW